MCSINMKLKMQTRLFHLNLKSVLILAHTNIYIYSIYVFLVLFSVSPPSNLGGQHQIDLI